MKIKQYIKKLSKAIRSWRYRNYYVVLDGRANSVTLGRAVYEHIMRYDHYSTDVLMFCVSDTGLYAFGLRDGFPMLSAPMTVYSQLQYNEEHRKVGFRSERPSVTAILSEYGCPLEGMVRLSVIPRFTRQGDVFYEIQRPYTFKTDTI